MTEAIFFLIHVNFDLILQLENLKSLHAHCIRMKEIRNKNPPLHVHIIFHDFLPHNGALCSMKLSVK